ncbi:MAG: hypothetical protein JWO88_3589, partial [Frankiales bacterium]|nr:hypothetical protein [Frankiales bacterium]
MLAPLVVQIANGPRSAGRWLLFKSWPWQSSRGPPRPIVASAGLDERSPFPSLCSVLSPDKVGETPRLGSFDQEPHLSRSMSVRTAIRLPLLGVGSLAVAVAAAVLPALPAAAAPAPGRVDAGAVPAAAGLPATATVARPGFVLMPQAQIRKRSQTLPTHAPRGSSFLRLQNGSQSLLVAAPPSTTPKSTWQVTYNGFDAYPQAKSAFQAAVDIWSSLIATRVPIKVNATFANLNPG